MLVVLLISDAPSHKLEPPEKPGRFTALVGADVGLPTTHLDDHAAYIGSWLSILRRDNRALLTAAARAEEAAGYLLRATGLAREDVDEQAAA
nr:zincin-like metallopeptidase domain-containing protein [Sphingobium sp. CFD-2]